MIHSSAVMNLPTNKFKSPLTGTGWATFSFRSDDVNTGQSEALDCGAARACSLQIIFKISLTF